MTTIKKQEMSVRALISYRGCVKTLPFLRLSLGYKDRNKHIFWKQLKVFLVSCMMKGAALQEIKDYVRGFFEQFYEESFFDFRVQYEAGREVDYQKLVRMVEYLYKHGLTAVAGEVPYQIPLNTSYRGVRLSGIRGEADMILRTPSGRHMAVLIQNGAPEYSYTARQESRLADNSIELACLYLGLCDTYGEDLETAIFYFKNKDDKRGELIEEYDHRKGKNIIHASFGDKETAWKRLFHAVSLIVEPDCGACHYKDVCRLPRYYQSMPLPEKQQPEPEREPFKEQRLTPAQQKVVRHKDGTMCVIAVPGAGKTHSLVQRLLYLIQHEKVNPEEILFLTFTQKAAGEIRERVLKYLGRNGRQPGIFTFHALSYAVLREHPESVCGIFRLAAKVDRYRLIEAALKEVPRIEGVSYDGITGQYGLLSMLNKAFSSIEMFGQDRYAAENREKRDVEGILRVYQVFAKKYRQEGYISYDEQIQITNLLFREKPEILRQYQRKYRYVMVDEFQDISEDQVQLVYQIAAHGNLVVVGDDDQSIYDWRGGSSKYMMDFQTYWKGAKLVTMEDNFRSVDTVIHAADQVIRQNADRFVKNIQAHAFSHAKPVYLNDIMSEGIYGIVKSIMNQGYCAGDIAIIARKNKDLSIIEDQLTPFVDVLPARQYLIDDAVFLAIRDILTMYYRGIEDRSLYRFFVHEGVTDEIPVGIEESRTFYEALCKAGVLLPINWRDVICLPAYQEREEESGLLKAGCRLLQIFKGIQYGRGLEDVLHHIYQMLYHAESHLAVDALIELSKERLFEDGYELLLYMDDMIRYYDETEIEYPPRPEAVNLLTGHKSKGKEYPVVILYGVESFEDTPEDRRLIYVIMTRAQKLLYITQAPYTKAELLQYFIGRVEVKRLAG